MESYATVEEVDSYITSGFDLWEKLSLKEKKVLLKRASIFITEMHKKGIFSW